MWNLLLPKAEQTKKPKAAHGKAETSTALNSGKDFIIPKFKSVYFWDAHGQLFLLVCECF